MDRADLIDRLRSLEPRLRRHGVSALYLYGSRARGEARPGSDIDLLADFSNDRDTGLMAFMAPYDELARAFPGLAIGFSTRDQLEPLYKPHIEASAVRIF